MTQTEIIGTAEAARLLGVSPVTITRWAADGTLPPAGKLAGKNGAFLFTREAIDAKLSEVGSAA